MEFTVEKNKIYKKNENGKIIAEVDFPEEIDGVLVIDHTFVDESLRGLGVAGKLMQTAADEIRKQGKKTRLTCSYAVKWFEKHKDEYADILA